MNYNVIINVKFLLHFRFVNSFTEKYLFGVWKPSGETMKLSVTFEEEISVSHSIKASELGTPSIYNGSS